MRDYMEYYQRNKQLDDEYISKYSNIDNCYGKNCLGLVVELCELANESRCFKYWSVKKANRDDLLEEYADCLSMLLCIFNYHKVSEIDTLDIELSDDLVYMFNEVVRMCTMLMNNDNVTIEFLKEIFTYLLHIGKLLGLSQQEILEACYKKIEKNEERLNSNY